MMKQITSGVMKDRVELLGTQLFLNKGQTVRLIPATNLPPRADGKAQYFAQPNPGHWGANSILITEDDLA